MMLDSSEELHAEASAKLMRMAQQIAEYFQSYPEEQAAAGVARHINRYWTPRMRGEFLADAQSRADLPPLLRRALDLIKKPKDKNQD